MKNNLKVAITSLATALLILATLLPIVLAADSGTSDGTVTVTSATPTVTNLMLNTTAPANANNTALTVNTEYHLNFTVSDSNAMSDLHNVTIWMWNSGGGASQGDSDSEQNHLRFTWVESTDVWSEYPSASWWDYEANNIDPGTGDSSTSYTFRLAFDLPKVANYSNGGAPYDGWSVNVTAYDDSSNQGSATNVQFGVAYYAEISVTDSTHTFSGAPNSNDNPVSAGGDAKIDITVITNDDYHIEVKSENSTIQSAGTPADEFDVGNVTHYISDTVGSSVSLTTSYADLGGLTDQTAPTEEASAASGTVYLWVDIPDGQAAHSDYEYVLTIKITQA